MRQVGWRSAMRWHEYARDAKGRLEGMSGLFGNRIDERWQLWALRRSRLAICPGTWPLTAYWSSLPIDGGKRLKQKTNRF
jgi:hypothetical protein